MGVTSCLSLVRFEMLVLLSKRCSVPRRSTKRPARQWPTKSLATSLADKRLKVTLVPRFFPPFPLLVILSLLSSFYSHPQPQTHDALQIGALSSSRSRPIVVASGSSCHPASTLFVVCFRLQNHCLSASTSKGSSSSSRCCQGVPSH